MGNVWKGILYTGLAGAIGAGGYFLGKYKHMRGKISLTMIGLALVLYAPKGCDVIETYVKTKGEVEKAKIYGMVRKDSIDSVVSLERSKDSSSYFRQFLQNATDIDDKLEEAYSKILSDNERRYNQLLLDNKKQYDAVLSGVIEQNENLTKDLKDMKSVSTETRLSTQSSAKSSDKYSATTSNISSNASSNESGYSYDEGKIIGVKKTVEGYIEDRVLPDGTKHVVIYDDRRSKR